MNQTTYVVSMKSASGERLYLSANEPAAVPWGDGSQVRRYSSPLTALAQANTMRQGWSAVELQFDHLTGKPFVFRTLPATAA